MSTRLRKPLRREQMDKLKGESMTKEHERMLKCDRLRMKREQEVEEIICSIIGGLATSLIPFALFFLY